MQEVRSVQPAPVGLMSGIAACLAGTFLLRVASNASGFYIGLLVAELAAAGAALGARDLGLLAATFYAAELASAPLFGHLADRRGYRTFLVLGPLFGLAGLLLMPLTLASIHSLPVLLAILLVVRVLEGLSTGASAPSTLGYLAAETSASTHLRGRVMGFFEVVTLLGIFAGPPLAGVVWRASEGQPVRFIVVALVYLVAAAAYAAVKQRHLAGPHRASPGGWDWLRRPGLWTFVPAWLAVNAILGAWSSQIVFQLAKTRDPSQYLGGGFTSDQVGYIMGAFGAAFTLGAVAWSFWLNRLGKVRVMRVALLGAFGCGLTLLWINHSSRGEPIMGELALLVVALLVMSGFTPAALTYLADLSEHAPGRRGATMGVYSVLLGVGQLVGGLLGGLFAGGLGPLAAWLGAAGALERGLGVNGLIVLTFALTAVAGLAVARLREPSQVDWTGPAARQPGVATPAVPE